MGAYSVAAGGGLKKPRTIYPNMGLTSPYIYGAMVPIATVSLTGSTAAFSFESIPQIYQDLMLVGYSRSGIAASTSGLYIRPSSSTYWSGTQLYGDGASAGSLRFTSNASDCPVGNTVGNSATSGIFAASITHFFNYANTTTFKTFVTRSAADANGSGFSKIYVNSTNSTVPITSIVIYNDGNNNWVSGSTFTLYGIRAANS
jgi:hypothetical protein